MYCLVEFDNEEMSIYPSSKVKAIEGSGVTVTHNGRGRYKARLLCINSDEQFLNHLMNDIKNKVLHVSLVAYEEEHSSNHSSIKKCLFEQSIPQYNSNEPLEKLLIESESDHESSLITDYEIIEKIYDKRDQDTPIHSYTDESDSGSELLPIEEQEKKQWDAFSENTDISSTSPQYYISTHRESDHKSSLITDYEMIENIYDKKDQDIPSEAIHSYTDESNSGSDWLPDEEQEKEQWDAFLKNTYISSTSPQCISTNGKGEHGNPQAANTHGITVLGNVLLKVGTTTDVHAPSAAEEIPAIESMVTLDMGDQSSSEHSTFIRSVIVEDYRSPDEITQSISDIPVVLAAVPPSSSLIDRCVRKKKSSKKHACLFCGKLVVNLPRHLRALHEEEESVKAAVNASNQLLQVHRNPKYRSHNAFEELRKRGDLQYNHLNDCENIITVRNSPKPDQTSFVCCPLCKGFYSRKCFKGHFKNCHMRKEKKDALHNITNVMGEARVNGQTINKKASHELVKDFFPYFTKPAQAAILFKDDTAVEYGNKLVTKYYKTNAGGKHHIHISSQLRLLADIFINSKIVNPLIIDIADLLHPKNYDSIIKAIQLRCGYNNGVFKSPTTASNCCTLLFKVTKFLKCEAIKRIDHIAEKRYANFEYLLANSQNHDITRQAQDNKTQFQRQKKEILPTTKEINVLLNVLDIEVTSAYEQASSNFNRETYTALAKASLAYLLVFNRKRPGDVERTQLLEIGSMTKVDQEYLSKMPDDDKKHAEEFGRYITQGKLNKKASNLIPKKAERAIDLLVEKRHEVGISTQNQYLFARVGSGSNRVPYFKADEALRLICQRNKLNYNKLNANKLRKHLATCTAMLTSNIQNVISDFMGHTMAVHQNVYQQKQAHTDIVVMGKILMEASGLFQNDDSKPAISAANPSSAFKEQDSPGSSEIHLNLDKYETLRKDPLELSTIMEESYDNEKVETKTSQKTKRRIMKTILRPKRTWQTPERKEIRNLFQGYIKDLQVPSIHAVQEMLVNKAPNISRNAIVVRSWLHAEINRIRKHKQGIQVQRWTTPERHRVRDHFKIYFDRFKETSNRTYPTNEELQDAVETVTEFKNKNAAVLRSKIQHEFNTIEKHLQEELESETTCSYDST